MEEVEFPEHLERSDICDCNTKFVKKYSDGPSYTIPYSGDRIQFDVVKFLECIECGEREVMAAIKRSGDN